MKINEKEAGDGPFNMCVSFPFIKHLSFHEMIIRLSSSHSTPDQDCKMDGGPDVTRPPRPRKLVPVEESDYVRRAL